MLILHNFIFQGKTQAYHLETIKRLERWVVTANGESKCPGTIKTISELRWYFYLIFQSDIGDLPPTTAALKYKIFRYQNIVLVLCKSLLTMQELPSPLSSGWESYSDTCKTTMTDELPAPIALIKFSICAFQTKYVNSRCKHIQKLQRTEIWKFINCDNDDTQEQLDEDELILDD